MFLHVILHTPTYVYIYNPSEFHLEYQNRVIEDI